MRPSPVRLRLNGARPMPASAGWRRQRSISHPYRTPTRIANASAVRHRGFDRVIVHRFGEMNQEARFRGAIDVSLCAIGGECDRFGSAALGERRKLTPIAVRQGDVANE